MRMCLIIAVCLVGLSGCAQPQRASSQSVDQAWGGQKPAEPVAAEPETSSTDNPTSGKTDPIVAVVNGMKIRERELTDLLMKSHGLRMLEEQILLLRARQRAEELGLVVTKNDIAEAHERALSQLQTPISGGETEQLSRGEAERLLDEFLLAKNLSQTEWDIRMEQRAYLRAIAEKETADQEITDKAVRREFQALHGERVQIRHIQLSSLAAVQRARALLNEKKDFELVARQASENQITAARGGLLPPFTRVEVGIAPALRDAAFALEPGKVSAAIHEGNWYHLIRVEQRWPADDVTFEDADRDALRARIRERLVSQRQQSLESELFHSAAVDIRHPELKRRYHARQRSDAR